MADEETPKETPKEEPPKPQAYHVWITALLSAYEKGIIHGLVSRGYMVSAADYNGSVSYTFKGAVATLIALKVEKKVKIVSTQLMDDVRAVLASMDAKVYSIVVSKFTASCTWIGTNISVPTDNLPEMKQVDKKVN